MLKACLRHIGRSGRLTLIEDNGRTTIFGPPDAARSERDVVVRIRGASTPLKLLLRPDPYLGEAYMAGDLVIERGSLWDLLDLCCRDRPEARHGAGCKLYGLLASVLRWSQQINSSARAKRNVAHHYDLSERLYRAFLDEDLHYSCAYFQRADASLDEAQRAKTRHIAAKLLLRPGCRVLDIGCGWGGLALALAEMADVEILGVTLSEQQLRTARQRAEARGLQKRVRFELMDYRALDGQFDRIVSVGMFEHVGAPYYRLFFDKVASLLAEDGVALIHAIGRLHGPDFTSAWIRRYIFPGGYIPALSQVMPAVEHAGLLLTDLEILRGHYAETLSRWRRNFLARRAEIARAYDEGFCRMWEFYLVASEMAFRHRGMMVFQAQLARNLRAVPLTRDYMGGRERALACLDGEGDRSVIADHSSEASVCVG